MTTFLRLSSSSHKDLALRDLCSSIRAGATADECFEVSPEAFAKIPGSPFPYWSSESLRSNFELLPPFEAGSRCARVGLQTSDDFRFVRASWEVDTLAQPAGWVLFVRGGGASKFFGTLSLRVLWRDDGRQLKAWATQVNGGQHWSRNIRSPEYYGRPGITWPLRAAELSPYPMPQGAVFSVRGAVAFEDEDRLLQVLGLMASAPFDYLFKLLLGRFGHPEFGIGALQKVPVPAVLSSRLGDLSRRAWSLKRELETTEESSIAFLLPELLRSRIGSYDQQAIRADLDGIQAEIDEIAFDLYAFSETDRDAVRASKDAPNHGDAELGDDGDEGEGDSAPVDKNAGLLSWCVGVCFGRFDLRLATGERAAPPEPEPFAPLPAKSPGMLPDGAALFRAHCGILVDDSGHQHDLAQQIEEVLSQVDIAVPIDVRRWLQKDFFPFHLQRYSKSRRKAPIYWPLSTSSGSYTLWVYYPSLSSQTLYTAINDFVEPKLKHVGADVAVLRSKGANRTREDEKQFEALQALELELVELRDSLLKLAPIYRPQLDDGVQISAAPLWPLFRHKPWQKLLKDTWVKLEKGEYDWAHLAMNYWPDRVRERCKTDKSLAIAHGLESLYVESEVAPKKSRGKKKGIEA